MKFLYRINWFNRANNFNWTNTLIVKTIQKSNHTKCKSEFKSDLSEEEVRYEN